MPLLTQAYFWPLSTFKERNTVFFLKFFVLIDIFGVPIIFLGFWIQPANSMPSGVPMQNCKQKVFLRIRDTFFNYCYFIVPKSKFSAIFFCQRKE
jgi:hypothetical protein